LNDFGLLAHGKGAEEDRAPDQKQAEKHEVVENLIPQCLAKGVQRDDDDLVHA
jgi:hypothetical protein